MRFRACFFCGVQTGKFAGLMVVIALPDTPDYRSPEAATYRKFYKTARWRQIRAAQLAAQPLCVMCQAAGQITPATVCDHIEPHKGDPDKFWGGPFQSLCKPHHDGPKQSEERTGRVKGCDNEGWPLTA